MSIKSIVGAMDKIQGMSFTDAFNSKDMEDQTLSLYKELTEDAEVARKIIMSRLDEQEFVKFMLMVQKMSLVLSSIEGKGSSIMLADLSGELQSYVHTVVLAIIGALIQEEVL